MDTFHKPKIRTEQISPISSRLMRIRLNIAADKLGIRQWTTCIAVVVLAGCTTAQRPSTPCDELRDSGVNLIPPHHFASDSYTACSRVSLVRFSYLHVDKRLIRLVASLPGVEWLVFSHSTNNPDAFGDLARCKGIRKLSFVGCYRLASILSELPVLRNVTELELNFIYNIGEDELFLVRDKFPNLTSLNTSLSILDDKVCEMIGTMRNIRVLNLSRTQVTGKGMIAACQGGSVEALSVIGISASESEWDEFCSDPKCLSIIELYCEDEGIPDRVEELLKSRNVKIVHADPEYWGISD